MGNTGDGQPEAGPGRRNLSAWAVAHPSLVLFLILAIAAAGALSYLRLGRAEDPSFTIKVAIVSAVWPGASAREMQDQVADRIEKRAAEIPYFHRVSTYAKPSFLAMTVEFKDYTPAREVPNLFYQLRKKLGDLKPELPAALLGPNVNDEYGDVDSLLYAVTAPGLSYADMKGVAEDLKKRLLRVEGAAKVNLYGAQEERVWVEFSHARLATLGVSPQAIFDGIARQNAVAAAGTFETGATRLPLRITGAYQGAAAVAETPVESGGRTFRLGDVATVTHGYADPPQFLVRQAGEPALAVGVVMAKGGNILKFGADVEAAMAEAIGALPQGVEVARIADQPEIVRHAVAEFMRSFAEALGIVLLVSFLSLGWRTGIVVALSVPLVLGIVFVVMSMMGMDLHRITLGALIIALGLLVDDAIIAVEMMVVKMEQGWDRVSAAGFAWTSTAFPMLTGTLVTAAGFVPVGFAQSGVGEYAGGIFWVVAIALIASWFVAVVVTPYLGVKLLPKVAGHADPHAVYETRPYRILRGIVRGCVRFRWPVALATLGVFALGVVGFGRVSQQFFPLSERTELFLETRGPEGSTLAATLATARAGEALLAGDADVLTYTTYVGAGAPRFWLGLNPVLPNEAFAQTVILSKDVAARERIKARLETALNDGAMAGARVRVDRFNFGPPVGFPVQFRVMGPDFAAVQRAAYAVRDAMREDPRTRDPHLDWDERAPALRLEVDQDRARALGLTPSEVAQTLETLVSGRPVTTLRAGTEKIEVIARAVASERLDPARVGELTVLARSGVAVPLAQVAKVVLDAEPPILWRRNRDATITVRADIVDGVQAPDVTNAILPRLKAITAALPPGHRIEIGGAIEESEKGNASLAAVFPVMGFAMLTLLMIQLQSFSRVLLVVLTAPLGLVGASLALNVSSKPFGFVALLGLIALAGMIMRNSVILVDQIEHDVAAGATRREAIAEATVRRARPVILTALAAILAMIPLSGSAFWGPMAVTIMGGLFVATFLTLLVLPALYALWFRRLLDVPGGAPAALPLEELAPIPGPLRLAAE